MLWKRGHITPILASYTDGLCNFWGTFRALQDILEQGTKTPNAYIGTCNEMSIHIRACPTFTVLLAFVLFFCLRSSSATMSNHIVSALVVLKPCIKKMKMNSFKVYFIFSFILWPLLILLDKFCGLR